MSIASTTAASSTVESKPRLHGFALASVISALMLTLLLEALDQAIVGTAMPRIVAQLHGLDRYSWVVTAYILASVTMIPIVGKLSDQFGRKWFLLCGTVLFLLGSILAGASQSMNQLILFRGMQGLGAGIGIALVGTVFGDLFPPDERAKWMSLFGIVYGVSSLSGPALGGWLSEHGPLLGSLVTEESRWRWVFYINVPLGLIAVVALVIFLPVTISVRTSAWKGRESLRGIDFPGALLCAVATICLMLGLTWGGNQIYAWTSPWVLGMLAAGIVLFVLSLFAERKALEPVLPLDLFKNQIFSMGALLALLQMMLVMGLTLYLPLFFQGVLSISPTDAGLVMTPFSMSMVAGAMLGSMAINRLKRYRIVAIVGALLMCMGALLITFMTPTTNLLQATLVLVLTGLGIGPFFSLPMLAVQNALPESRLGVSTAAVRYLGQVGATLGIAIVGTVVSSAVSGNLMSHLPTSNTGKLALAGALSHGFLAILVFALIALVATFFLKDVPILTTSASTKPERMAQTDEAGEESTRETVHA
ncbi:MAG TPA: MDR family MFS transporter [Ktedonobacteraceae bacterium]|nr:MDR family MFS transporter [Ktedonobacteraceae bacterium]